LGKIRNLIYSNGKWPVLRTGHYAIQVTGLLCQDNTNCMEKSLLSLTAVTSAFSANMMLFILLLLLLLLWKKNHVKRVTTMS